MSAFLSVRNRKSSNLLGIGLKNKLLMGACASSQKISDKMNAHLEKMVSEVSISSSSRKNEASKKIPSNVNNSKSAWSQLKKHKKTNHWIDFAKFCNLSYESLQGPLGKLKDVKNVFRCREIKGQQVRMVEEMNLGMSHILNFSAYSNMQKLVTKQKMSSLMDSRLSLKNGIVKFMNFKTFSSNLEQKNVRLDNR